jgi:hypothetical protein
MKVKLAVVFAVLLFATIARADSQQVIVDVNASACTHCYPNVNLPPVNLIAQFIVEPVTGTFVDVGGTFTFTGTEYEVVSAAGTLNGSPITLATGSGGAVSWLWDSTYPLEDFALGTVYFTSDGLFSWLENDNEFNLLETLGANGYGSGPSGPLYWSAVEAPAITPEPSALLLSAMGVAALIGLARKLQA